MSEPTSSVPLVKPRNFWQRRIRDPIVAQLTQGITPEKIALTVAVGSAFALFPVLGTTTLLCFLVAWALRLNQPIIQLINQALWPVHFPVIFGCIRLGETMFGAPHVRVALFFRKMRDLVHDPEHLFDHLGEFMRQFGLTMMHGIVAWAIITPFYIAIVYFIAVPIAREVAILKQKADLRPPTTPPMP